MKNFRGSALAAGVGTPESVPHELLRSSLVIIWITNIGTVSRHENHIFGPETLRDTYESVHLSVS